MKPSSLPGARSPRLSGRGQSRRRLPPGRLRTGSRAPAAEARPHVATSPPAPATGERGGGGRRGGRGSGAAAAEKLRLRNRSESASASSRSVHVDGPKRKSLGRTEGEPAGGLPTATCAFSPAVRRRDAWGRVGVRRGRRVGPESGSGGRASPEAGVGAEPATSP